MRGINALEVHPMKIPPKTISDLKKRKESAFRVVYDQYYRLIYHIALTITKDRSSAEEVVQDTFVTLMNHIEEYQDDGRFKQYLTTIARRLAIDAYRRQKQKNSIETNDLPESAGQEDRIEILLTLEHALTMEEAQIVSLKVLYDYSFREIAEDLNLTLGTVQAKYYKALEKLKKHFEGE